MSLRIHYFGRSTIIQEIAVFVPKTLLLEWFFSFHSFIILFSSLPLPLPLKILVKWHLLLELSVIFPMEIYWYKNININVNIGVHSHRCLRFFLWSIHSCFPLIALLFNSVCTVKQREVFFKSIFLVEDCKITLRIWNNKNSTDTLYFV